MRILSAHGAKQDRWTLSMMASEWPLIRTCIAQASTAQQQSQTRATSTCGKVGRSLLSWQAAGGPQWGTVSARPWAAGHLPWAPKAASRPARAPSVGTALPAGLPAGPRAPLMMVGSKNRQRSPSATGKLTERMPSASASCPGGRVHPPDWINILHLPGHPSADLPGSGLAASLAPSAMPM